MSKVDAAILARIKKALALARHEGTGEQEAKAAFRYVYDLIIWIVTDVDLCIYRMATKLMSQHR